MTPEQARSIRQRCAENGLPVPPVNRDVTVSIFDLIFVLAQRVAKLEPSEGADNQARRSMQLVQEQFRKAQAKGYTADHDREHGAEVLIKAGTAYAHAASVLHRHPESAGKLYGPGYGWPFPNGWNSDDVVMSLVKAAHLFLSAADVIESAR